MPGLPNYYFLLLEIFDMLVMLMSISDFNIHGNFIYMVSFVTKDRESLFLSKSNALLMTSCILTGRALKHYWLLGYAVMPDHVHIIMKPNKKKLSDCIQQLKGASSHLLNRNNGRSGELWEPDYFARPIEYMNLLENEIEYVEGNPIKDGLVEEPEDYLFSSALIRFSLDIDKIDEAFFWDNPYEKNPTVQNRKGQDSPADYKTRIRAGQESPAHNRD